MTEVDEVLIKCAGCGEKGKVETHWSPELFQYGTDDDPNKQLFCISIPVRVCRSCNLQFTDEVAEKLKDGLAKTWAKDTKRNKSA